MDAWRYKDGNPAGWETVMARLLETSLPMVPETYDAGTMIRLVRTIEDALTRVEIPSVISGKDDTNGISWFMD